MRSPREPSVFDKPEHALVLDWLETNIGAGVPSAVRTAMTLCAEAFERERIAAMRQDVLRAFHQLSAGEHDVEEYTACNEALLAALLSQTRRISRKA